MLVLGSQQVYAATSIESYDGIYYSGGDPMEIYSDPELTKATGQKLATNISKWRIFQVVVNEAGQSIAANLGSNQWVVILLHKPTYNEVVNNSYIFKEDFSGGKRIQLYSDPNLTKPLRKLNSDISDWAIIRTNFMNQSEKIYSFDLGHNEWASIEAFPYILPKWVRVDPENTLVDANGATTGRVADTNLTYATFGVKYINGKIFINLGSDQQWISKDQVTIGLI